MLEHALVALLNELADGPAAEAAFVLNSGDRGLLRSLDTLSAAEASATAGGESTIAAHVDHLRYGFHLMNRWSRGESPFADADYSASWRRTVVTEDEWKRLRASLRAEIEQWRAAIPESRERKLTEEEVTGMVSSVVHLAYHVGAMRQMNRALRGPKARV
jgi:hypothetical protein